jgi:hypothetical protein
MKNGKQSTGSKKIMQFGKTKGYTGPAGQVKVKLKTK